MFRRRLANRVVVTLDEFNRKILTLNPSTLAVMHRSPLNIEQMVSQFREEYPLFA